MFDFDEIKDINGKSFLAIENNQNDYDDSEKKGIGNKIEYFEYLQELGAGKYGKVFKVLSKLNNKIYAMKKINLKKLMSQKEYQLVLNESEFLTALSHPHIIKYYKCFEEGDNLCIIVENAENGDMADFIQSYKESGKHIPEKDLWSIFLQCMQGLTYVHKMGVIHRDIKPGNILMDNNMNIKIGDFGASAVKKNKENNKENIQYLNANYSRILENKDLQCSGTIVISNGYAAKEIKENNEYDQKIDVYSMGVTFYEMIYLNRPEDSWNNDEVDYSKEMIDIINEMIEEDKDKRQTSEYFLEKIKEEFSKKYNRNTSIDTVVRCLYSLEDITNYYKTLNENEIYNKPITQAFIKCLNTSKEKNIHLYYNSIKYFRELICTENKKFDKTKEIDPKLVLAFIIRQLHNEINYNILSSNKMNNYYIKFGEEKVRTSEVEMMISFQKKFFKHLNSFITQKIMGNIKTIYKCEQCYLETYSFSGFFFVSVDLENIIKYINPDIKNYFQYKNNYKSRMEKYCSKCLVKTIHEKYEKYDTFPDYLIIIINRGKDYSIRIPFKLKQNINLLDLVEIKGKKYRLVGFINKNYELENFTSFIKVRIQKSKKWFICEKEEVKTYDPNEHTDMLDDTKGGLIMAFYEAK